MKGVYKMVKRHESQKIVMTVSNRDFHEFFRECMGIISTFNMVHLDIEDFLADELSADDLFTTLDEMVIKSTLIREVSYGCVSVDYVANKYLSETISTLDFILKMIHEKFVDIGLFLRKGDAEIVDRYIKQVIGGLSFFLITDFGVLATYKQILEGKKDYDIDEIFELYSAKSGKTIEENCKYLEEIFRTYRIRFDFFDEHPELEEDFEEAAGSWYNLVKPEMLTVPMVQDVISGKIKIEDLISEMEVKE